MLRGLRFLIIISLAAFTTASAQNQGGLKGKVLDKANNEPIPFANIVVLLNGNQVGGGTTNFDGEYFIKPLAPGKYDVKATYVGYQPAGYSGVIVSADKISFQNISMSQGVELKAFEFVSYEVPLIDKDNTASGGTITRADIAKMPGRSAESVALTVGGIYSQDGERGSVRGSRSEATDTYIDGVKVRGSSSIPNSAIEQVSVVTGGLPSQYGDATGGIISITTRGPSSTYFGGVELVSSQLTDKYGYNLLGFTVSGPLWKMTDPLDSTRKVSKLGFFLSGELRSEKDPRPSAIGSWKLQDSVLTSLHNNPLRPSGTGDGTFQNAEFIHISDLERIQARQNVGTQGILLQGKVDVTTSSTTNLTLGGTYDYSSGRIYSYNNLLFNSENNGVQTDNTWRAYARFTQRFGGDAASQQESASNIKNAYYSLQVDYSKETERREDKRHRDNLFNYGHIGKFTSTFVNNYQYAFDTLNEQLVEGFFQDNFQQVSYEFEPGTNNPVLANYTNNYYDLAESPVNSNEVVDGGGLLNGGLPAKTSSGHIYNIWNVSGLPYNGYSNIDNSQFRMRATGSADIKNHAILIGFEYEQRSDRFFSVSPYGLWTRGRQLANTHIDQLDKSNPQVDYFGTLPTITYQRLNSSPGDYNANDPDKPENQTFFDYNLRKSLGLDPDGIEYLDVDSYDPSQFSLDYFSANELLNEGSSYVSYYGYDHTGKKLKGKPSFDDFFNARDEYGNLKREIGAFQPIYISGYIQDKFAFDDLVFNVGVRVDRFDANQKVLKDPFSLFETVKAGEVDFAHPENIGDNYVMYVGDINDPNVSNIVGYRDGARWFNAEGVEINDPGVLVTATGISPWLLEPSKNTTSTDLSSKSFKDYDPQVTVMPRIAFSFPISDEALFFAHYDVLSKRPGSGLRLDPTDYLFIQNITSVINNPDLKPEKTIDYELGFQQKLNKSSSLKLSAFYRELRNMVQVVAVNYAYPRTYKTYGNIDFGTVKGMTIGYDLRRTGNVSFRTTYTLQFADGTGSSATTGINLINAGQPNLRQALPLSFDQRHAITTALDYRYGTGKDYNGPIWFDQQVLANTGLNIIANAGSGVPYTRQSNITPTAFTTGAGTGLTKGTQNGSRLPWQVRMDVRLDRDINLKWGKEEEKQKTAALNVYVLFLNALNSKNIINVYSATGNTNDDGYLAAAQFQADIDSKNDPQSFTDLYNVKLNNPANYSLPRRIRVGVQLNF